MKLIKFKKLNSSNFIFIGRTIYFFVLLACMAIFIFLVIFIHEYGYKTITQSEEVMLLRKEVAPDSIDTKQVDKIINAIEAKKTHSKEDDFDGLRDPFSHIYEESLVLDATQTRATTATNSLIIDIQTNND